MHEAWRISSNPTQRGLANFQYSDCDVAFASVHDYRYAKQVDVPHRYAMFVIKTVNVPHGWGRTWKQHGNISALAWPGVTDASALACTTVQAASAAEMIVLGKRMGWHALGVHWSQCWQHRCCHGAPPQRCTLRGPHPMWRQVIETSGLLRTAQMYVLMERRQDTPLLKPTRHKHGFELFYFHMYALYLCSLQTKESILYPRGSILLPIRVILLPNSMYHRTRSIWLPILCILLPIETISPCTYLHPTRNYIKFDAFYLQLPRG